MRQRNPQSNAEAGEIIVGIDGSRHSIDVLREGARIARGMGSSLKAIAVWQPQQMVLDYGEIQRNPEMEATQALYDISKFVFGNKQPAWYTTSSMSGDPAQLLIDASANAEMLIVGAHNQGGLASLVMGSVSQACVHRATCPVLVVRAPRSQLQAEPPPHTTRSLEPLNK